jgi:glycosyltransferase involved in cell wall biosynthesis
LIFVGRLVEDNGIIELVEAFKKFNKFNSKSKLILVGDFEEEIYPLNTNTKNEITENVNIISTGFISDIRPFLSISDCCLFPSYREGLPNVLLQASCFNLPIITTNINGCNEIIHNNINGLLVSPKSSLELFNAMKEIFINEDLRNKFKYNTRSITTQKYNQETVWANSLNEYNNLLKNVR